MAQEQAIASTRSGMLKGTFEDGLYVFKGIPFAGPASGEFRWMPPQPVKPWTGVRSAEQFGPICPQSLMRITNIPRPPMPEEPQSEDCLFLNVWSPDLKGKRPVMVWIHGGAFVGGSGSSPMHPGATLPKRGGVVLVSVNYRLGALGFMNLNEITGGKIPATGAEGLLDQVAAIRWVHDNIASFGGDPDNVTIFGESAGAMTLGCILAMPAAKGLFKKAIMQSGSNTCRSVEAATTAAEKYLEILGVKPNDAAALRALPVKALLEAQQKLAAAGIRGGTEPVIDIKNLPVKPLEAIKAGAARDITVIAGGNLNEGTLFAGPTAGLDFSNLNERVSRMVPAEYASGLVAKYRQALAKRGSEPTAGDVLAAIQGDRLFRMPNLRLTEIQANLGLPSYNYVFTWKSVVPGLGACHALDVGFVFGSTNKEFHGAGPAVDRLAMQMQEAWTSFARTGNPSCPSLGEWPQYGKERRTMVLGENSRVENAPYETERAAWEQMPDSVLG